MGEYKIFVSNVSYQATDEDFVRCFGGTDGLTSATILKRYNSIYSKGYGILEFNDKTNRDKIMESRIELLGRLLKFSYYDENKRNNDGRIYKIFVLHPTNDTTDDFLKKVFSKYGEIKLCYTRTDYKGHKYSIIGFGTKEILDKILKSNITVGNLNIIVRPFKRKQFNKTNKEYINQNKKYYNPYFI